MDSLPVYVLSRWVHVGTAIVVLGGAVFLRYVLLPAAAPLPEAEHLALRERLMGRWRKFIGIGIGLLLLSGFYNYLVVALPGHKGDGLYHGLIGTKIILAFVVFFLASALGGRAKAFAGLRENSRAWLAVTIALGAIIVAISGYLKVARPATAASSTAPQPASTETLRSE